MLDEIDQELLRQCEENPGQTVATIISPLLRTRKERTLYDRIAALEAEQLIVIDRSIKNKASVILTEEGKAAIIVRADPAPQKDADFL
jgi:hypothetical protein